MRQVHTQVIFHHKKIAHSALCHSGSFLGHCAEIPVGHVKRDQEGGWELCDPSKYPEYMDGGHAGE